MTDPTTDTEAPTRLDIPTILELGKQLMPDFDTMSAVEARAVLAALPAFPGPDVESVVDVQIADGLSGRHYVPLDATANGPLVVYYHGGGFTIGDCTTYDGTTRRLSDSLGLPLVSVEYRLAPEHRFPAAVDDAWQAFTWAASTLGADGLIVAGDSAGANLAAGVARRAANDGVELLHQLLFYPCFDPAQALDSHGRPENDTCFLSTADMAWYWRQYLNGADVERTDDNGTTDERIDPRRLPVPDGLAAATVVIAGVDPLHDEGAEYAATLEAAGVQVSAFAYPDLFHGFIGFAGINDQAGQAFDEVVAAVRGAVSSARSGP